MTSQDIVSMREEAAAWIARMDADRWGDSDEDELKAWLDQDERHHGILLQTHAIWISMDGLGACQSHESEGQSTNKDASRRLFLAGGATAMVASLVGGIVWLGSPLRYSTDIGEVRRLTLMDGSIATINTMSRIEVKTASARREIRIDEGEAWLQVAKDPTRPLIVSAGRARALALGTAFSVRKLAQGAEIFVTEGLVKAWPDTAEGAGVRLAAGEGAFIGEDARVVRLTKAAVDRALAWRFGNIDLLGQSLADAAVEFNRYNKRKIIVADPVTGSERLDGTFQFSDPEGFALAVGESLSVPVDLTSTSQIVIGRYSNTADKKSEGYPGAGSLFP